MAKTIQETIDRLHSSLKEYIEATYHIGDPSLIEQRRTLLERIGVTHQEPFLETTPRYQVGSRFKDVDGLPEAPRPTIRVPTPRRCRSLGSSKDSFHAAGLRDDLSDVGRLVSRDRDRFQIGLVPCGGARRELARRRAETAREALDV